MADFEKGKPADQSGKVMPFPTIDKVKFYREHLHRSIDSIRDRMAELVNIQDSLYAEVIELETCLHELHDEMERIKRIYNVENHEETDR